MNRDAIIYGVLGLAGMVGIALVLKNMERQRSIKTIAEFKDRDPKSMVKSLKKYSEILKKEGRTDVVVETGFLNARARAIKGEDEFFTYKGVVYDTEKGYKA